jgi:hypothetical protein
MLIVSAYLRWSVEVAISYDRCIQQVQFTKRCLCRKENPEDLIAIYP